MTKKLFAKRNKTIKSIRDKKAEAFSSSLKTICNWRVREEYSPFPGFREKKRRKIRDRAKIKSCEIDFEIEIRLRTIQSDLFDPTPKIAF